MLLGITERLEFVNAPAHAAGVERYRARGYPMAGVTVERGPPVPAME